MYEDHVSGGLPPTATSHAIVRLFRPELATMQPYTPLHPFEVASQRLGRPAEQIVKLDANENPYGRRRVRT